MFFVLDLILRGWTHEQRPRATKLSIQIAFKSCALSPRSDIRGCWNINGPLWVPCLKRKWPARLHESPLRWEWLYGRRFRIAQLWVQLSKDSAVVTLVYRRCSLTACSRERHSRENGISSTWNRHRWEANAEAGPPGKRLDLERSWQFCAIFDIRELSYSWRSWVSEWRWSLLLRDEAYKEKNCWEKHLFVFFFVLCGTAFRCEASLFTTGHLMSLTDL